MNPNIAATITPVVESDDAEYTPIGNDGSVVFLRNDLNAPNRRIIAIDLNKRDRARGKRSWRNVPRRSKPRCSRAAGSSPSISSTCRAG